MGYNFGLPRQQTSKFMKTAAFVRGASAGNPAKLSLTVAITIEIPDLSDKTALNRAGRRLNRLICEFGGSHEEQETAKDELLITLKQAARRAHLEPCARSTEATDVPSQPV